MSSDSKIFVVDRIKDRYISGGENVYAAEIEDVIDSFDEVSRCTVIGVADPLWEEAGLDFVQRHAAARCRNAPWPQ